MNDLARFPAEWPLRCKDKGMTGDIVRPAETAKPPRSATMAACLKDKFLYCEKRARDYVFQAAEELAGTGLNGTAPLLHRLMRSCAERAQAEAACRGYEYFNWDVGAKTTLGAMLQAGVLLTNGDAVIPSDITARGRPVVGLCPDFRDRTEAYLIEVLIRELGDVTVRDHMAIAHALFRQFDSSVSMEDLEDRVTILLAHLCDRVELTDAGVYWHRDQPVPIPVIPL